MSICNDDPFHARSSSTLTSRLPYVSAKATPNRELQDKNMTSTESNAGGDVRLVYKEMMPRRNLCRCCLFCSAWCDNKARCIMGDSLSANGWNSIFRPLYESRTAVMWYTTASGLHRACPYAVRADSSRSVDYGCAVVAVPAGR